MPIDHAEAQAHFSALDVRGEIDETGPTWSGPIENCDVCSRPMASETYMIDGPVERSADAPWGNLCVCCALKLSPVIAWGKAQLYRRQGAHWSLVAGGPPAGDADDC